MRISLLLLPTVLALQSAIAAIQPLPFADSFTNAEGNLFLVAPGVWDAARNSGTEITISNSAALTAPAGLLAATGKGVRWVASGTSRRAGVQFNALTNGDQNTVYVSFLLKIVTPPGSGSKLIAFLEA